MSVWCWQRLLCLFYAKLKCCSVSDWEKKFAMEIMGTGGYWLQVGGLIIVDALQAKMLARAGRKLAPLFVDERSLVGRLFSAITNKPSLYWLCRVRQSRRRSNITTTSHSAQYSEEAAKSRKQPKSWKQWDQRHNSCSLQKVTGLWVRAQLGDAKLELLCWELGRGLQRRVTTHGAGQLDTAWYSWPHPPLHHTTGGESGRTVKHHHHLHDMTVLSGRSCDCAVFSLLFSASRTQWNVIKTTSACNH